MYKKYLLLVISFFALLLNSCSNMGGGTGYTICIDPNWYPIDFKDKTSYVSGFTEELLLEMTKVSSLRFEKTSANWDTLFSCLKQEQCDAVLSALQPYNFNMAEYDFSNSFLDIGPVLITLPNSKMHSMEDMNQKIIGILSGSRDIVLLQKSPNIIIRMFDSAPEMLTEVERGGVDGALLSSVPAASSLNDGFYKKIVIASPPLDNQGLRLITVKGKHTHLQKAFNSALQKLKRKKIYQKLLLKWGLSAQE